MVTEITRYYRPSAAREVIPGDSEELRAGKGVEAQEPLNTVPQSSPKSGTRLLAQYWIERWLSKRIENQIALEQVAPHSLAYPIRHGAQVRLPEDELPETLYVMATA